MSFARDTRYLCVADLFHLPLLSILLFCHCCTNAFPALLQRVFITDEISEVHYLTAIVMTRLRRFKHYLALSCRDATLARPGRDLRPQPGNIQTESAASASLC